MCNEIQGTKPKEWVTMGVVSDGSYGIEKGLMYGFPVACIEGEWQIIQGLPVDEFARVRLDANAKELIEEKKEALEGTFYIMKSSLHDSNVMTIHVLFLLVIDEVKRHEPPPVPHPFDKYMCARLI